MQKYRLIQDERLEAVRKMKRTKDKERLDAKRQRI